MDNQTPDTKESFSIHCWGLKIDAANPGKRTLLMLVLLLLFFLTLVWLLKEFCLPLLAVSNGKNMVLLIFKRLYSKGK
jgi:hypothetical protein